MNHPLHHTNGTVTAKPSIVKDALMGLMTAIGIGLLASAVFVTVVLLLSSTALAFPQEKALVPAEVGLTDVHQGSLLFRTDKRGVFYIAPTVDTNVEMKVSGMIVRSKVVQTFTNPDDFWVEGVYVFPLPDNAAVDHMRMKIGDRIIEGEIKERQEAHKTYAKAKREGKKAALMDQERPNVFTNSVANIGPNESVTIEIEYQQTLHYEQEQGQGKFEIRFPLTMTPRYIPGTPVDQQPNEHREQQQVAYHREHIDGFTKTGWAMDTDVVPDASRITPPYTVNDDDDNDGRANNPVTLKVELNAGFPINQINSPYHSIHTAYLGQGQATVQLAQGSVPADRDFDLVWTIDSGYSPKAALFNEKIGDDLYNLIMVMPPTDSVGGTRHLPREVIYIIDTSGSMGGTSIQQAKSALTMALSRLRPGDNFNVIQFNSTTSALFRHAQAATNGNVKQALRYVDNLYATGGTEMFPALTLALQTQADQQRVRQIIFLTDGSVGNESQLFELIKSQLGNSRLFTVGIGSAPNSYFMTRAAEFGRGTYTFIGSSNEVQEKMQALFTKLETPVLTDLQVVFPDDAAVEVWPKRIPDLYLGEPVVVAAKMKDFDGNIQIKGKRADTVWEVDLPLRGGQADSGVGTLWARAKIKDLMDTLADGANKDDVKKAVVNVALQHHLVSKFTSMIAVDKTPSRETWDRLDTRAIPNNLPHGSTMGTVVGSFAKTATNAQLKLLIGLMLLTFSLIAVWHGNRQGAWFWQKH